MKRNYIFLIVWGFIILFLPIAYYYWYALPKLERDKFEYQMEKDRKAEEKKIKEQQEAERKEKEKKQEYEWCKLLAEIQHDSELKWVCEASYNACKELVDRYNRDLPNFMTRKTYNECDKYKYKEWKWCIVMTNLDSSREERYKTALKECDKILNL